MNKADAEEFTQSLGQIVAGSWRQIALAKRLGVPAALKMDVEQWVRERLGGYIRLSIPERRDAVKELTGQQYSTREVGQILGISHETVRGDVKNLTPRNARSLGDGSDEWYTPPEFAEMARSVFGGRIDLDPFSCEAAQRIIKAKRHFTKEDDGLTKEWRGRAYVNGPFSQITQVASKVIAERHSGRVSAAIMLTHACTDAAWWHKAAALADAICFTRGRIKFIHPDGHKAPTAMIGQTFFYFGDNVSGFAKTFGAFGLVVGALKKSKEDRR